MTDYNSSWWRKQREIFNRPWRKCYHIQEWWCQSVTYDWLRRFLRPSHGFPWEYTYILGLYRIWLFQIQLELDLAGFRNSNPAGVGSGFEENLFWNHRTSLMELMASTMLSAAIKRMHSSVLSLLHLCLPILSMFTGIFIAMWILSSIFNHDESIINISAHIQAESLIKSPLIRCIIYLLSEMAWTWQWVNNFVR